MIDLSILKGQKKIIVITAIVIAAFWIFLAMVYFPQQRKTRLLKQEFIALEQEISSIENMAEEYGASDEGLTKLSQKAEALKNKFPLKEEESLRLLSEWARNSGLEVISLKPQVKKALPDSLGNPVMVKGLSCQVVKVSFELSGNYGQFLRYVETLEERFPVLVVVQEIQVVSNDAISGKLALTLDLSLFLLT